MSELNNKILINKNLWKNDLDCHKITWVSAWYIYDSLNDEIINSTQEIDFDCSASAFSHLLSNLVTPIQILPKYNYFLKRLNCELKEIDKIDLNIFLESIKFLKDSFDFSELINIDVYSKLFLNNYTEKELSVYCDKLSNENNDWKIRTLKSVYNRYIQICLVVNLLSLIKQKISNEYIDFCKNINNDINAMFHQWKKDWCLQTDSLAEMVLKDVYTASEKIVWIDNIVSNLVSSIEDKTVLSDTILKVISLQKDDKKKAKIIKFHESFYDLQEQLW